MRSVVDKAALSQISSGHFDIPLPVTLHQCSILTIIYTLLLPERQKDKLGSFQKSNARSVIVKHSLF
jgi:hypothetical protein